MNLNTKILITGAGGFVGTHLVKFLVKEGYSLKFISRNPREEGETLIFDEFMIGKFNETFFEDVSVVIHLAAIAHNFNFPKSEEIDKVGLHFTEKLLNAFSSSSVKKIIYLSSIAVSILDKNIILDTYQYGISKRKIEELLKNFNEKRDNTFQITILRPPLIYGKGAPGNFLKLLKLLKKPLVLPFGSFENKRSFLFIDNLVSAIGTIIRADTRRGVAVYELSDPWFCTLSSFMSDFKKASGSKVILIPFPQSLLKFLLTVIGAGALYQKLALELKVDSRKFQDDFQWKPACTNQIEALGKSING